MPAADPSLSLARKIDDLGDSFEQQWRAGKRPRIEDYLSALPAPTHDDLLRALIPVELELLAGDGPSEADYHRRFPGHGNVIGRIELTASWPLPPNSYAPRMYQAYATVDGGPTYTGRTMGEGMVFNGKRTKG